MVTPRRLAAALLVVAARVAAWALGADLVRVKYDADALDREAER